MAKLHVDQVVELCDQLFKTQAPMLSLWQTLAEHFYPERADFTSPRNVGEEIASDLLDSYPVLARRDLGNSIGAMLRSGDWMKMGVNKETSHAGDRWLEWATKRQLRYMSDPKSNFHRATREGDHDYVTFGQPVISIELNRARDGVLYRCWHLRDCAWWEDETGRVSGVTRKWSPTYRDLHSIFGDRCHDRVKSEVSRTPFATCNVRHLFMPAVMYGDDAMIEKEMKYVSVFVDIDNKHILEEVGLKYAMYIVPRFATIAGHPYAFSPATVTALPNSRLLQSMTFTIMEAAERYTRPPLIAQQNVIRGDVDMSPLGVTYIDSEYDERTGDALRPLAQNMSGLPIGLNMKQDVMAQIASCFFLDKLNLPATGQEMTAYEVEQRMKQYRREVLPLIAPTEMEYNAQLCESTFDVLMAGGLLGSDDSIPDELRGEEIEFSFTSPVSGLDGDASMQKFAQLANTLQLAISYDKQVVDNVDFDAAFRGAVESLPKEWINEPKEVMTMRQMQAAAVQSGGAPGVDVND